jgi:hypothetical protein
MSLVTKLKSLCPEASVLEARTAHQGAVIGLEDEGEWVPLLKLAGGSAACNVMWLLVADGPRWTPTGLKGTPAKLATHLSQQYAYLWAIAAAMTGFHADG